MRKALIEEMRVVYGRNSDLGDDDAIITSGCNMAFIAVIMCLAGVGDEVILPVPWYVLRPISTL